MSEAAQQELALILCQVGNIPIGFIAEQIIRAYQFDEYLVVTPLQQGLATLLNLPDDLQLGHYYLIPHPHITQCPVLLINNNPHHYRLSLNDLYPLPPLMTARCTIRGLSALALINGQLVFLIDLTKLPQ